MISKFDLAKGLRDQAKIVTDANSLILVSDAKTEDEKIFIADVNNSHVVESVLYGDDSSIGLAGSSSDIQIGIYQLSVYSPKIDPKWTGLRIVDLLQTHFVRTLEPTFNGQKSVIVDSSIGPMMNDDSHFVHHLSIRFSVIA